MWQQSQLKDYIELKTGQDLFTHNIQKRMKVHQHIKSLYTQERLDFSVIVIIVIAIIFLFWYFIFIWQSSLMVISQEIVIASLNCASENIEDRKNSWELYGFDFMVICCTAGGSDAR